MQRVLGRDVHWFPEERGALPFSYAGQWAQLQRLNTVLAVFLVQRFGVPRPRALLGEEHLRMVQAQTERVRSRFPAGTFQNFYLSAAGSDSAVMQRLKEELARRTNLQPGAEEGDLLLRLRPAADGSGWELLLRTTPRPLATRAWRVCNMEGALNASVAHAMALLTRPQPNDIYLNLGCGSGTLLIERLAAGPARRAIGCDTSQAALACAEENVAAAGLAGKAELQPWDMGALPLPDGSVDALTVDLPFGNLVGSHHQNMALYPRMLAEAGRVARPDARFVIITHEMRLMEQLLPQFPMWQLETTLPINLSGLHPRIFLLRRATNGE
jgi:23S rRNA G2445 N2-methylase RlmL